MEPGNTPSPDTNRARADAPTVLFLCVHNAGRSQMAAGWLERLAGNGVVVLTGGSAPATEVNPIVLEAMAEVGIDLRGRQPKRWRDEMLAEADVVVTMGCGDECPFVPGKRYEDWELPDPSGQPLAQVREIREAIRRRTEALLESLSVELGAGASAVSVSAQRSALLGDLEAARTRFHALLDSMTEEDLERRSTNQAWSNGEVLFHIFLAFRLVPSFVTLARFFGRLPAGASPAFARLLDWCTGVFNLVNGLGPRLGGRFMQGNRLGIQYDRAHSSIVRAIRETGDEDWERGMYYPTSWDPMFEGYQTLEGAVRYAIRHFEFHVNQLNERSHT